MVRDGKYARPEDEVLISCARTRMSAEKAERITALMHEELDWAYLVRLARWHSLAPLLFVHLNTTCPEAVPQTYWRQLREQYHTNARHNLYLTGELLTLLRLFASHNIQAVPFKGPVLAATMYGDLALRQFGDLDILVHHDRIRQAKDLLLARGYQLPFPMTETQEDALLQSCNAYALTRAGTSTVDLHWSLTRRSWPAPLDPEQLWEHLVPVMRRRARGVDFCTRRYPGGSLCTWRETSMVQITMAVRYW